MCAVCSVVYALKQIILVKLLEKCTDTWNLENEIYISRLPRSLCV